MLYTPLVKKPGVHYYTLSLAKVTVNGKQVAVEPVREGLIKPRTCALVWLLLCCWHFSLDQLSVDSKQGAVEPVRESRSNHAPAHLYSWCCVAGTSQYTD
jgi:hypothetical protein